MSDANSNEAPVQAESSADLHGVLQQEMSQGIRGWVMDKNNLSAELSVKIRIDDRYEFEVPANVMRQDLWNGVSGNYGFDLKFLNMKSEIFEAPIRQIRVSVCGHDFELANSPMPFNSKKIAADLAALCEQDIVRLIGDSQRDGTG